MSAIETITDQTSWDARTLADICELRKEQIHPKNAAELIYIGLEHIKSHVPVLTQHGDPSTVRSNKNLFYPGDVLYGKLRPYLDKAAIATTKGICSTDILILKPSSKDTLSEFIVYLLHTERFINHAIRTTSGVNHPRTSWSSIGEFNLHSPPLPEQKAIAQVLRAIQNAIAAQKEIIARTRELKQALMAKLFTEGLHGEKTKETEIGPIPESWDAKRLEDVTTIERGKFSHRPRNDPDYYEGDTPFIQTGDITASNGRIRKFSQTLNEKGLAVSRIFPTGTILITIAANIGDTGILMFDGAFPDSIIGMTPFEGIDSEFLEYYLRTQRTKMNKRASKGTQKNINIEFLKPWPVPRPSFKEQKEIAGVLNVLSSKENSAIRKQQIYQELFKSMLHELMTGQTRATALIEE